MARELDDALLHLRLNEPSIGLIVFRTVGDPALVLAADSLLEQYQTDWLVREIRLLLKRVLKRIGHDRAQHHYADRAGKLLRRHAGGTGVRGGPFRHVRRRQGGDNRGPATLHLSALNFSAFPMGNGLSRLANRFYGEPDSLDAAAGLIGETLDAEAADATRPDHLRL